MAFALFFNGLLLLALFTLGPRIVPPRPDDRLPVTFDVAPSEKAAGSLEKSPRSEMRARQEPPRAATRPVDRPARIELPPSPLPFLVLSSEQMAKADIGRLPGTNDSAAARQGAGAGPMAAGPGEGPGGVQLFPVDWHREPSDAELSPYLPANRPPKGWGEVACKTVDDYRVENCQQIGESPLGSGFARAVRLAAWQFRVRPPRVNGKSMVGTWVRIRIDYSMRARGTKDAE
ncbi:MAG: hypothetical protein AB7E60_07755 [Sphingobium sp.]